MQWHCFMAYLVPVDPRVSIEERPNPHCASQPHLESTQPPRAPSGPGGLHSHLHVVSRRARHEVRQAQASSQRRTHAAQHASACRIKRTSVPVSPTGTLYPCGSARVGLQTSSGQSARNAMLLAPVSSCQLLSAPVSSCWLL
jgi:hypothetical protein